MSRTLFSCLLLVLLAASSCRADSQDNIKVTVVGDEAISTTSAASDMRIAQCIYTDDVCTVSPATLLALPMEEPTLNER